MQASKHAQNHELTLLCPGYRTVLLANIRCPVISPLHAKCSHCTPLTIYVRMYTYVYTYTHLHTHIRTYRITSMTMNCRPVTMRDAQEQVKQKQIKIEGYVRV